MLGFLSKYAENTRNVDPVTQPPFLQVASMHMGTWDLPKRFGTEDHLISLLAWLNWFERAVADQDNDRPERWTSVCVSISPCLHNIQITDRCVPFFHSHVLLPPSCRTHRLLELPVEEPIKEVASTTTTFSVGWGQPSV